MTERAAKAICTALAAALPDEVIRVGFPQDTPDRGIWCLATGGFAPVDAGDGEDLRRPTVQVFVRGARGTEQAVEALAVSAYAATNRTSPTGYTSVRAMADPAPLQNDTNERPRWVFNLACVVVE